MRLEKVQELSSAGPQGNTVFHRRRSIREPPDHTPFSDEGPHEGPNTHTLPYCLQERLAGAGAGMLVRRYRAKEGEAGPDC